MMIPKAVYVNEDDFLSYLSSFRARKFVANGSRELFIVQPEKRLLSSSDRISLLRSISVSIKSEMA